MRSYKGSKRNQICFPIGGIGTGCIGLDGTGRFRDWEIFNRSAKGSPNGYSCFTVRAKSGNKTSLNLVEDGLSDMHSSLDLARY